MRVLKRGMPASSRISVLQVVSVEQLLQVLTGADFMSPALSWIAAAQHGAQWCYVRTVATVANCICTARRSLAFTCIPLIRCHFTFNMAC